jgi:hypothetical protein
VSFKLILLYSAIVLFSLLCSSHSARATEVYLLGGQQVLLYKTINWWYFASAADSRQLCGESIAFRSSGTAEIHLSPHSSSMEISFNEECAPLLAMVGKSGVYPGTTSVNAFWMNKDYFTSPKATLTIEELAHTNNCSITVENVQYDQQDKLLANQSLLTLSVTGTVHGLMDGKVALSPAGDLLEKCGALIDDSKHAGPPILMVSLWNKGPPLLKFTLSSK